MNTFKLFFLSLVSLISLSYACINVDVQIDGNATDSSFDIDVKYRPGSTEKLHPTNADGKPQQTHEVTVGQKDGRTTFEPQNVTLPVGDLVLFHFISNGTLTSSSLENPCTASGLSDVEYGFGINTKVFVKNLTISISNADPVWYFSHQANNECSSKDVFAINPGNHMDEFLANAQHTSKFNTLSATAILSMPSATSVAPTSLISSYVSARSTSTPIHG